MLTSVVMSAMLAMGVSHPSQPEQPMLWLDGLHLARQATLVLEGLRRAEVYGLQPRDYELALQAGDVDAVLAGRADADVRRRFDAALSQAASRFMSDLHKGRVDPRRAGFDLPSAKDAFDATLGLRRLASSPDVTATLESFEPSLPPYKHLKAALGQYRALAEQPQLTLLPPLPSRSIKAGDPYAGAPQLRGLLRAVGDLTSDESANATTIDATLVRAIQSFQRRHGLAVDGVIGPRTFAALTMPFSRRVQQIILSMERWRWLAAVERPNIVINIPQYMLFALPRADGPASEMLEMRVIVGKTYPYTRTPVFTTRITHVVFQPYWDVPRGILMRELLPRIRADESFLDRHHMEIVQGSGDDARAVQPTPAAIESLAGGQFRLRQRPGPDNALGAVKLVMPNPYAVYLHATPEQALFERAQRTFSHGCIRVSEPAALVAYVLRGASETWDSKAIDDALCGHKTFRVAVERPVSVAVFYTTAVATQSDGMLFFDDIYGHDRKLEQLLDDATN